MRWLDSITDLMDMNLSKVQERVEDRRPGHAAGYGGRKELNDLGTAAAAKSLQLSLTLCDSTDGMLRAVSGVLGLQSCGQRWG